MHVRLIVALDRGTRKIAVRFEFPMAPNVSRQAEWRVKWNKTIREIDRVNRMAKWETYIEHKIETSVIGNNANVTHADSFPSIFDRKIVIRFRDPQR